MWKHVITIITTIYRIFDKRIWLLFSSSCIQHHVPYYHIMILRPAYGDINDLFIRFLPPLLYFTNSLNLWTVFFWNKNAQTIFLINWFSRCIQLSVLVLKNAIISSVMRKKRIFQSSMEFFALKKKSILKTWNTWNWGTSSNDVSHTLVHALFLELAIWCFS